VYNSSDGFPGDLDTEPRLGWVKLAMANVPPLSLTKKGTTTAPKASVLTTSATATPSSRAQTDEHPSPFTVFESSHSSVPSMSPSPHNVFLVTVMVTVAVSAANWFRGVLKSECGRLSWKNSTQWIVEQGATRNHDSANTSFQQDQVDDGQIDTTVIVQHPYLCRNKCVCGSNIIHCNNRLEAGLGGGCVGGKGLRLRQQRMESGWTVQRAKH
jgi:hypothetical protein